MIAVESFQTARLRAEPIGPCGGPHNRRVLGFGYERETGYKGWPHVLYRLSASSARSTSRSVV